MKKASRKRDDDLRPEYHFSSLKGGVRGKYSRRLRSGTNIVRIEPELAKAFPTDEAVNEALRYGDACKPGAQACEEASRPRGPGYLQRAADLR